MKHSFKYSLMITVTLMSLIMNAVGVTYASAVSGNLALNATTTASSEHAPEYDVDYVSENVIDGIIGELETGDWASDNELTPWLQLDWSATQQVSIIKLYDRSNFIDQIYAGTLTFSDGSSILVDGLPNDGSVKEVSFPTKSIDWVRFEVTSGEGMNVGLSEFEAYLEDITPPGEPIVSLDNATWDFGDVQVGNDGWQGFTLTNTGTADLVIGTLEMNGSDFSFNKNYCSDATLLPSDECYFEVYFTPDSAGAKSGSVSIPSNASTSPDGVDLSGNGVVDSPSAPVVDAPEIVTNDATPVISGTADAYSWINVWYFDDFDNPVLICEDILVNEVGDWSCVSSEVLPEREIALAVNSTDDDGNTSEDTYHYFIVDLTAPSAPVVDLPAVIVNSVTPEIGGTAEPYSWINVWYFDDLGDPILICDNIWVDEFEEWSCTSSEDLPEREIALAVNATDGAGNTSEDTYHYFIVDLTAPTVDSIVLADADPTVAAMVNFTVTFSKPLNVADGVGVGTDDFTLDNAAGEIIDPWVDSVTPDSACEGDACDVYTVTVGTGTGAGTLRLDVPVDATISDLAGNSLAGLPFTDGEAYTIDKGLGKFDDGHGGWTYDGFTATTTTGPYLGTMHYSKVVGSEAAFPIDGSQITLWYSKYSNRGTLEVYVDDGPTPIVTINQYNATRIWQASWTSGDLGRGENVVRLVHAGCAQLDVD